MVLPLHDIQLTREYLMRQRDAYLAMVDNIERILEIDPRTAELRKAAKQERFTIQLENKEESVKE